MKFREIVSITGMSGLYQLLATKSDGAIVKSIEDGATKFVAARSHSVTALDGIEVFTMEDNVRLFDVFLTMKENAASAPSFDIAKADNNAIKARFGLLFPSYDSQRVYVSDMKKMIKWLAILDEKGLLVKEEAPAEEAPAQEAAAPAAEEAVVEKKPKAKAKKADAESADAATEEKPKAKRATKKAE